MEFICCRVVVVASRAGALSNIEDKKLQEKLLSENLTEKDIDTIVQQYEKYCLMQLLYIKMVVHISLARVFHLLRFLLKYIIENISLLVLHT